MPKLLQSVIARWTADRVQDDHYPRLQKDNTSPMGEARIDASCVQVVAVGRRIPLSQRDRRFLAPAERTTGKCLVPTIDTYRIMRGRSTKSVAFRRVCNICKGTGIDQNFAPT